MKAPETRGPEIATPAASGLGAQSRVEGPERFEELEHQLLGASGFEGALAEVEQLEKAIGIHDLAQFTSAEGPARSWRGLLELRHLDGED